MPTATVFDVCSRNFAFFRPRRTGILFLKEKNQKNFYALCFKILSKTPLKRVFLKIRINSRKNSKTPLKGV